MDIAFVLVKTPRLPDPTKLVSAARALGHTLRYVPGHQEGVLALEGQGGKSLLISLMPIPHPDAPHMMSGPTSPTPDEIATSKAHLIVAMPGLVGEARQRDTEAAALTAAVIACVDGVGAMLGHGVVFYKAPIFAELAALGAREGVLPVELAVDVTAARESETRMSFLTHGMLRYGREELYVTCSIRGQGGAGFLFGMVRWLLTDMKKQLPTGDTIGRTAEEKIRVQRVPSPTGRGPEVIRLDME